jgi:hypothetical protein
VNAEFHAVGCRRASEQKTHRVAIEDQAGPRAQVFDIETFGADQSGFLANGENDIDGRAGNMVFLDDAQNFTDDDDAAFVVAAEHCGAIGAQDISVNDRHDTFAGNYRVHVR